MESSATCGVFDRAEKECDIDIVFRPTGAGNQQNDCRDDVVAYVGRPTMPHGRRLAQRLQAVTTHRSGLGLLFLMTATTGAVSKVVISRFPADQGIVAEEERDHLSVKFLERVFMKSARAYKSVLFKSDSLERGFWQGHAVDRQISGSKETSDYWVYDFLMSELRTMGPAGTKRVAVALRSAIQQAEELEVRQELIATANLLRGQDGQTVTARRLVERLGLSEAVTATLESQLPRPDQMDESFRFDAEEFARHVLYRMVELDNGAALIADDRRFEEVFGREVLEPTDGLVRFTTQGRVVDERLRRNR